MADLRGRHIANLLDGAGNSRHHRLFDGVVQRASNFDSTWGVPPLSRERQALPWERPLRRRSVSSALLQARNGERPQSSPSLPQLFPTAPKTYQATATSAATAADATAGAAPAIATTQSGLLARRANTKAMSIATGRRPSVERRLMRRTNGRLRLSLHDSDALSTPGGCSPALQHQSSPKRIQRLSEGQDIFDLFSWNEVLQEDGDGGKVVVCQPKRPCNSLTRRSYIMKMRSKASLERGGIPETFRKSQERLLNLPSHVGVLPLHKVFEDDQYYYMIMNRADGGAFLPSLVQEFEDGVMPETEVKRLVREILEALCHLHSQGMLHRDIKPDNLVMQCYNNDGENNGGKQVKKVALIDFDHADPDFSPATPHRWGGFRGTIQFSAPDAICGDFSRASDLYSVGVVLYLVMTGQLPYPEHVYRPFFEDVRDDGTHPPGFGLGTPCRRRDWKAAVVHRMQESTPDWDCSPWPELASCKAFCQMLMAFDARARPASAEEALAAEWLAS